MIDRYSRPAMKQVWSDENKYLKWMAVELAACEAWTSEGVIPEEDMEKLRGAKYNHARMMEIFETTRHDVTAFLSSITESMGPEGRWLHLGLTSSDMLDTGLDLQLVEAGTLLQAELDRAIAALSKKAVQHKDTLAMGRTHGIHAEPMTMGLRFALWWDELNRQKERLTDALENVRVGMVSGAVGTHATVPPSVEEQVCSTLGLKVAKISNQVIQRDRYAHFMSTLALIAASLEKFATEFRALQRTEIHELEEPFAQGQTGSSSMPHKRNPELSERICGLARVIRGNANTALENVALWGERDISHSSAERIILPDSCLMMDYILSIFSRIIEGMRVYPKRMFENIESSRGLVFSQRVLLALVDKGLAREDAYTIVQTNSSRSWEEGLDFRDLLREDPQAREHLSLEELEELFDYGYYTRYVDEIFARLGLGKEAATEQKQMIIETQMPDILHRGKVRDTYGLGGGRLLMVATDRISAFDVVLPTGIADKGLVLNRISAFWFDRTKDIVPNHFICLADSPEAAQYLEGSSVASAISPEVARQSMVVKQAERIDIECIVRGYITGSAWSEYRRQGTVSGMAMEPGLVEGQAFPELLFTPTTKAEEGHDENMSKQEVLDMVGADMARQLEEVSKAVFKSAHDYAKERGIILADTKMEFGIIDGELTLIDELLTPDSSRFWAVDGYSPGKSQPNYDKQFVRDWLDSQGWDHEPPAPELPGDVVAKTSERYREAYHILTGAQI